MAVWKKCSMCKTDIQVSSSYYECSVSTCNGKRTGYVFCSVPCWERHLPTARHRDAAAIEKKSPSQPAVEAAVNEAPKRRIIGKPSPSSPPRTGGGGNPHEILVVASKLKAYIKDEADMNTSQSAMSVLSDFLRTQCDRAIENARRDGRKTVLDRDFK